MCDINIDEHWHGCKCGEMVELGFYESFDRSTMSIWYHCRHCKRQLDSTVANVTIDVENALTALKIDYSKLEAR